MTTADAIFLMLLLLFAGWMGMNIFVAFAGAVFGLWLSRKLMRG